MTESTEATGRTLEEAKRAAAQALGRSVEECEFEIIEQKAGGLFARDNFRVRAWVKPHPPEAVVEWSTTESPPEEKTEKLDEAEEETEGEEELAVEATQEDAERARATIEGIFQAGRLRVGVKVKNVHGRYVDLELSGPDVGFLLESRQPAIDSLQYLANAMMARSVRPGVRITLDADSYRMERNAALIRQAKQIAAQVRKRQQEAVLDPLPAHERRVIHQALADFEGVETYSEGEEPNRRVVISPKPS